MIKEGTAREKEKGTDGAIKCYKVWQTCRAWRRDSGCRAEWMLLRRKEEERKNKGDIKGRGVNELYHITRKSQHWVRNLKIQGFINHLAWQRARCISENYCHLLAGLMGACQTQGEANSSHGSPPAPPLSTPHTYTHSSCSIFTYVPN